MMERADIAMPAAKAGSAIAAAAASQLEVADRVAGAATANASYDTWMMVNAIPWAGLASMAAAAYTILLISEWFWKKLWRPFFEARGWIKVRRRRIISVEEYEGEESVKGQL